MRPEEPRQKWGDQGRDEKGRRSRQAVRVFQRRCKGGIGVSVPARVHPWAETGPEGTLGVLGRTDRQLDGRDLSDLHSPHLPSFGQPGASRQGGAEILKKTRISECFSPRRSRCLGQKVYATENLTTQLL